jgi:predicted ATPase
MNRGELHLALALAEECLQLAEQTHETELLLEAYLAIGCISLWRGELIRARAALEQSVALYQPQHQTLTPLYGGLNPRVVSLVVMAHGLWILGYSEQAWKRMREAQYLAQDLGHPYSLALALCWSAMLRFECGDGRVAHEHADAGVVLASEHGFLNYAAWGTALRGGALIVQEQWGEGIAQIRQGLEAYPGDLIRTAYLTWLARGYEGAGQVDEGLVAIAEALRLVEKTDERFCEAEVYRIKGELLLAQSSVQSLESSVKEAEECFLKAVEIAQHQQAKSLELRAVMSLARLWQRQGKTAEARQLLAEIYGWFTEGFDTKDLRDAKALLEELA